MDAVFLAVFRMSITGSLFLLLIFILRRLLRAFDQYTPKLFWGLVALRFVLPLPIQQKLFGQFAGQKTADAQEWRLVQTVFEGAEKVLYGTDVPTLGNSRYLSYRLTGVSVAWIIVCTVLLLRLCINYHKLKQDTAASLWIRENIWICDGIRTSFVMGIFRPKIYIPSAIPSDQMEQIVAHEKAHINNFDHIWKLVGGILTSVYWFQPLVWLAYRYFCEDMELWCDKAVIRKIQTKERRHYADILLQHGAGTIKWQMPPTFESEELEVRIMYIANYRKNTFKRRAAIAVLSMIAGIAFISIPPVVNGQENIICSNVMSDEATSGMLVSGDSFGFENLASGEMMVSENAVYLEEKETISWQVNYAAMGLKAECILIAKDGTQQEETVTGGSGCGEFQIEVAGEYRIGVRCSTDNLQYENTAERPLLITGTVAFWREDKE